MKETVLEKFQKIGDVQNVTQGGGNWMTIVYSEDSSVSKALAYNSQYLSDKVIIGVKMVSHQEPYKERPSIYSPNRQDYHSTQYLKRIPRRKANFWEKFNTYILNIDN